MPKVQENGRIQKGERADMKAGEKRERASTVIYVRGVSRELRGTLARMANKNNRSVSAEVLTVLEKAAEAFVELEKR